MRDKQLNTSLNIRLSQEEKIAWKEKAAYSRVSLSNLIREAMSKTRTWNVNDRTLVKEQICQIKRIGNNLNQIAKWANTYKSKAEAVEVIEALKAIEENLTKLSKGKSSFPSVPTPEAIGDVTEVL